MSGNSKYAWPIAQEVIEITYLARSGLSPHFCGRLSRSGYHLAGGRITSKLPTAISSAKLQYREEYFIQPVWLTISYSRHTTTTQQASRHILLAPKRHRILLECLCSTYTKSEFCEGFIYPLTYRKSWGRPGHDKVSDFGHTVKSVWSSLTDLL